MKTIACRDNRESGNLISTNISTVLSDACSQLKIDTLERGLHLLSTLTNSKTLFNVLAVVFRTRSCLLPIITQTPNTLLNQTSSWLKLL